MYPRRVVITGMGAVSPYGLGVPTLTHGLWTGQSGLGPLPGRARIRGLSAQVAGIVPDFDSSSIARQYRRSMSRMSQFAWFAAQEALKTAAVPVEMLGSGRLGIAVGSTLGSVEATEEFFAGYLQSTSLEQVRSTTFFKIMSHSVSANLTQALGVTGRSFAPAAACSSGCQAIGLAYETIAFGKQEAMLCGGADEFSVLTSGTFDVMQAASGQGGGEHFTASRPFDLERDGVVCAEGAGLLFLETLDQALERGASVLGEICGFACTSSPKSIANPDSASVAACMRQALQDAELTSAAVDYVNAHATSTRLGDVAEGTAIARIFPAGMPVSSLKGHMGHTMAASGALETIAALEMLRLQEILPTLHLRNPDPECGALNLPMTRKKMPLTFLLKNSFALGGVNSSLILRRYT